MTWLFSHKQLMMMESISLWRMCRQDNIPVRVDDLVRLRWRNNLNIYEIFITPVLNVWCILYICYVVFIRLLQVNWSRIYMNDKCIADIVITNQNNNGVNKWYNGTLSTYVVLTRLITTWCACCSEAIVFFHYLAIAGVCSSYKNPLKTYFCIHFNTIAT
jgi:hypothetical protein